MTEYAAIGLSSVLLALIYVASVSLYLHSRKSKNRQAEKPEGGLTNGRDGIGVVKSNPLMSNGRIFDSDTNSILSESDAADDFSPSDGEPGFENVMTLIPQIFLIIQVFTNHHSG